MTRISSWLHKVSTGRVVLVSLVVFSLFIIFVLPAQSTDVETDTQDMTLPDLSFTYTTGELYNIAEVLGQAGRQAYIKARFTFDVVWPIVYTVFLTVLLSWTFQKTFSQDSVWQKINVVPLWGALCDFGENIATSIVMFRYPARTAGIDLLATLFTPVKWILISVSFIFLLFGLGKLISHQIHKGESSGS